MGEAFYDMDRINNLEFNTPYNPLENFNRIKSESYSGRIVNNIFGGGTSNTEFAFLTGHCIDLYEQLSNPYMLYIRKETFSLARVFEALGYSTMAFHPGESWFYNRRNVYKYFGFDDIYFKQSMDLNKVTTRYNYISDMDTVNFI